MTTTAVLNLALRGAIDADAILAINELISEGANPKITTANGRTVLHAVAHVVPPPYPIVGKLIERGADIEAKDDKGYTPLHEASLQCNVPIMEALIQHGANVNATNPDGSTPLHMAVAGLGSVDATNAAVKLLIAGGADRSAKDKWGDTPAKSGQTFWPRNIPKAADEGASATREASRRQKPSSRSPE